MGLTCNVIKKKFNVDFTRVEAMCHYKYPATYDDIIEIETSAKLENDSFLTFLFRVFRKGENILLAEGRVRTVCVRLGERFKIVRIPEEVMAKLKQAIEV